MNKKINNQLNIAKAFTLSIWKILRLIWKCSKFNTSLSLLVTIIEGAILPLNMISMKFFIDSVTKALAAGGGNKTLNDVFLWLAVQFLITISGQLITQLNGYLQDCQSRLLNTYISKLLIEKTNELDISYFEDPSFYDNIEKTNNESISRTMAILETLMQLIKSLSTLAGAVSIVFSLNPIILLLSFLTTIPMFIVNIKLSRKRYDIFTERMQEARFARYLQSMIMHYNNIKEIKLYRLGEFFRNTVLSINIKHMEQDKKMGKYQLKNFTLINVLNNTVSLAFQIYVVLETIRKGLTIGSMTMYISALTNIDGSIRSVLNNMASLYTNNLYIDNLFSVLDLEPKIKADSSLKSFDNKIINSIEFKNVSFKYPNSEKYVLKNINLTIKSGETCAFVGLNGCGKTTVVKLLSRLYDPTEGVIYIDGKDIREYNIETLHRSMSIVFQDFVKYPFTVKQNIGFGNINKMDDMELVRSAAKKSGAKEFIERLSEKYDTKLEKMWTNGTDLSLGQWQKIAISRAFMSDACMLILDEPTASLDAEAEYELFQNFRELIGNATCVLISHRFSTVKMADIIYVIENGHIVEAGDHKQLMSKGALYHKLFNMQAEAYNLKTDKDNVENSDMPA